MSRLDELPPDQRAALSLLLRQHKSYAEVAQLLGIDERAVHDRAHAAIAMIAPRRAREVSAERRLEIGDYLLSQQAGVAERLRTRTYLSGSEQARAWAGEVSAALAPLAGAELPEIPAAGGGAPQQPPQPQQPRQPQRVQDLAGSPAPAGASATPAPVSAQSSSRLGGALVLGVIVAAIVVAIVLLTGGGSSKGKSTSTASTGTTSTAAKKAGPTVTARLALRSPDPTSKSVGVVDVLSEGGKRAFFIEAQHLPRTQGFFYAIWLYNSHTSALPLSKSPPVGASHKLAGGALLPDNAGDFHEMLLTRETATHPTHPGHVVLRGPFRLTE
jgi:hypothetical protein